MKGRLFFQFILIFTIYSYPTLVRANAQFIVQSQVPSQEQVIAKDTTTPKPWKPVGNTGANISQVSFTNWSQGGDNTITWSLFLNLGLDKEFEKWVLKNKFKAAFGMTKAGEADFRNNENDLFLETVIAYKLAWAVDPFFSNTIRTVITDGYNYKTTPATRISTFFDPGYVTQSLGFAFDKVKGLNSRLGLAFQETFTKQFRQYTVQNQDSNRTFKFETGIESVTSFEACVDSNLKYVGRFRLFGRFDKLDVWDVRFDNTITAKISKYFNVNFTALIVHEVSQTRKTQIKQGLQLGIVYNIFE